MTSKDFISLIIKPTLTLLGPPYNSPEATASLLTIALHESGELKYRQQIPVPYAKGWWMFEQGGGCDEFENHRKLGYFRSVARNLQYPTRAKETWPILPYADILACIMARGLLWIDPSSLALIDQPKKSYDIYLRRWRPGKKPSFEKWARLHLKAWEAVTG